MVTWRFRCRLPCRRTPTRGPVDQPGEQPGRLRPRRRQDERPEGRRRRCCCDPRPQPRSGPEETSNQGRARLAQLGDPPETHTLTSGGRPVTESPEGLASCGGSSLRARRCLRGGLLSAASRSAQSPEARRLRHAGHWVLAVYAPERSVGGSGLHLPDPGLRLGD